MKEILKKSGSILLLTIILASGLVISRIILYKLGVVLPRMPQQASESTAIYYLLLGSLLLSSAFYFLFSNIAGSRLTKFFVSFVFIFIGFGVGVTIESAIYSNVGSYNLMIIVLFFPVLLFSFVISMLLDSKKSMISFKQNLHHFFTANKKQKLYMRLLLTIISFPIIYFIFGLIASPFVTIYYDELVKGLDLPQPGTIILIQFVRSIFYLLITIPLMMLWRSSRKKLIFALGITHFVMVFAYDIYLAIQMPLQLLLIHGIEILADSFIYAWIIVKLLYPLTRNENFIND